MTGLVWNPAIHHLLIALQIAPLRHLSYSAGASLNEAFGITAIGPQFSGDVF